MSNTKRKDYKSKGKRVNRDKSVKKKADRKHFGFTSGIHSAWEKYKADLKDRAENDPNEKMRKLYQERYDKIKNKPAPVKGEDYIKYGYGKQNKETKVCKSKK